MNSLKLSEEQKAAILHTTGPALVIAGPGSGKTTIIVNRIINLIRRENIDPSNILVITFSRPAAILMRQRFLIASSNNYSVTFGTFHSIFYNIVKHSHIEDRNSVATHSFKRKILKDILISHNIDDVENEYIDLIIKRISFYKNSSQIFDNEHICDLNKKIFLSIYHEYNRILKGSSKLDFEDMMLICKDILEKNESICEYWQQRFRYILIDEFQDVNRLQFDIIRKLAGRNNNLFVVGDDDQSIYGFRGARPDIMLGFKDFFENTKIIKLTCNYRSDSAIVKTSDLVIRENINRFSKRLYTNNPEGILPSVRTYSSKKEEICQTVISAVKELKKCSNVAILCRTNLRVSEFAEEFIKNDIDCHVTEKIGDCYDSEIFRDFLRYLRLAYSRGAYDRNDFIPVMNKPLRYLSRLLTEAKTIEIDALRRIYKDKPYVIRKLNKLEYDLNMISKMDMFSAFTYFRRVIGYDDHLAEKNKNDSKKHIACLSYADELQEKLFGFKDYNSLIRHIEKIRDISEVKEVPEIETGIYVMTYHASKGLEFDCVYVPGLIDGEVPSRRSSSEADIEEERRMFYVAMTRARHKLILSYSTSTDKEKQLQSRFLLPLLRSKNCINIEK